MSNVKKSAAKANRAALKLATKLAAAALVAQSTTLAATSADEPTISQTAEAAAPVEGVVIVEAPVAVEVAAPVVVIPQNTESVGLIKAFAEKFGLIVGDTQRYLQRKGDAIFVLEGDMKDIKGRISIYADAGKGRPAGLFRDGKRLSDATASAVIAKVKAKQAAS